MKRWLHRLALTVVMTVLVLVAALLVRDYAAAREAKETETTKRWLQSVSLPSFELHDTPIEEAVAVLNRKISTTSGHPRRLQIRFATPQETAAVFRRKLFPPPIPPLGIPGIDATKSESLPASGTKIDEVKITVSLSDGNLYEALRYVAGLGSFETVIRGKSILLHNFHGVEGTCDPFITKTFHLSISRAERLANYSKITRAGMSDEDSTGEIIDMRPIMAPHGVEFYEGCIAELNTKTSRLRFRNTRENIDLLETLTNPEPSRFEKMLWWIKSWFPDRTPAPTSPPIVSPL